MINYCSLTVGTTGIRPPSLTVVGMEGGEEVGEIKGTSASSG